MIRSYRPGKMKCQTKYIHSTYKISIISAYIINKHVNQSLIVVIIYETDTFAETKSEHFGGKFLVRVLELFGPVDILETDVDAIIWYLIDGNLLFEPTLIRKFGDFILTNYNIKKSLKLMLLMLFFLHPLIRLKIFAIGGRLIGRQVRFA